MQLIADSGGSTTEWRLVDENKDIYPFKTDGMHPLHQTGDQIRSLLEEQLFQQIKENFYSNYQSLSEAGINEVNFYGSGCNEESGKEKLKTLLQESFPQAKVLIETDTLGAARALCNKEPGIACVLGTGSASCFFDGNDITQRVPALGYILGDEGSGSHFGRLLLRKYFRNELSAQLNAKMEKRYDLSLDNVYKEIYNGEDPAGYLARFSRFVFHNMRDPYIFRMVYNAFVQFFQQHIMKYENYQQYKVHFTGSVAFYYANILRKAANEHGIRIVNILEKPIAGLTLYHIS